MQLKTTIRKNPVAGFFISCFLLSWFSALALVAAKLWRGQPIPKLYGILMFPLMLLGPFLSGIWLTGIVGGRPGRMDLWRRIKKTRVAGKWYLLLLLPLAAIWLVLCILSRLISDAYLPGLFAMGFVFGIPAGILEEIGWMGFAFPALRRRHSVLSSAIILGLFWGLWHFPVINFLGTAVPHRQEWLEYFVSFILVMMAIRVIICWLYTHTESVFLCQLFHISSTGFLVVLSPSGVSTRQEPVWYFAYAFVLWCVVAAIVGTEEKNRQKKMTGRPAASLPYS